MFEINKKNTVIMFTYLTISTVLLAGYLLMVALPAQGYDPGLYERGYLYLITFQFLLFSLCLPFWDTRQPPVATVFGYLGGLLWPAAVITALSVPLILIMLMAGSLNHLHFLWPLSLQVLWGMFILSARDLLAAAPLEKPWPDFCLALLIFTVLVLTLVFFYYYLEFGRLVVTTIYDRDIPAVFFLNPLLTTAGLLHAQTGGSNQLGWIPVIYNLAFYIPATLIAGLLTLRNRKKAQREV